MSFFLFTSKFIRFRILHSDWVRLNLSTSCFIMVCLHGKVIVIVASQMFSFLSQPTFITIKVSFNTECFKNCLSLQYYLLFLKHYYYYCYQYTSLCASIENLFKNQEVLQFIIIAFILITLMFDLGVILKGEIIDSSHYQGLKG